MNWQKILGRAGINVKLFADDVKLYMQIVNSCDTAKLQYALDLVTEWAKAWQLTVSINKCCLLSIGRLILQLLLNSTLIVRKCHLYHHVAILVSLCHKT